MNKIAVVGYHATGSGVIDDLLRELDNTSFTAYNAELRILHDPDCISDLEYHIVKDPHRSGSGLAIKRFINYCKTETRMEERIFGDKWMLLVTSYAESLCIHKYKGWMSCETQLLPIRTRLVGKIKKAFFYVLRQKPFSNIFPTSFQRPRWYNYYPNITTYYANLSENEFLEKTKSFVESLCNIINVDKKEFVVLNQFTSSHNPMRDLRYVDDMKVIIVDRDPRDLFVHNVIMKDHRLPSDPLKFAKQYRLMRKRCAEEDPAKVLHVQYEDMIFKYDETVPVIMDFLGIDASHHIKKKTCFKPGVSINGTQLWIYKATKYVNEIQIIEKELPDMLYVFPDESVRNMIINEVDTKTALKEYATKH